MPALCEEVAFITVISLIGEVTEYEEEKGPTLESD